MAQGMIVFYITPRPDGMWQLERENVTATGNLYRSRETALEDARQLAKEQTPSIIRIMGTDGTVSEEHSFPQLAEDVRPAVVPKSPPQTAAATEASTEKVQ